jgi:hypothetical protein
MKNRAKVHLLPTNDERAVIGLTADEKTLWFAHSGVGNSYGNRHLYITTDDEIKEGDWCLFFWDGTKDGELGQVGSEPQQYLPSEGHTLNRNLRKIIATTDPKLHSTRLKDCPINPEDNMVSVRGVSKPPKSFIEEYCKVGGIDEVMVEYEEYCPHPLDTYKCGLEIGCDEDGCYSGKFKLKLISNNEIIIHLVKDSWTVEDLPDLLNRFCKDHSLHRGLQITDGMIREWLEKQ